MSRTVVHHHRDIGRTYDDEPASSVAWIVLLVIVVLLAVGLFWLFRSGALFQPSEAPGDIGIEVAPPGNGGSGGQRTPGGGSGGSGGSGDRQPGVPGGAATSAP